MVGQGGGGADDGRDRRRRRRMDEGGHGLGGGRGMDASSRARAAAAAEGRAASASGIGPAGGDDPIIGPTQNQNQQQPPPPSPPSPPESSPSSSSSGNTATADWWVKLDEFGEDGNAGGPLPTGRRSASAVVYRVTKKKKRRPKQTEEHDDAAKNRDAKEEEKETDAGDDGSGADGDEGGSGGDDDDGGRRRLVAKKLTSSGGGSHGRGGTMRPAAGRGSPDMPMMHGTHGNAQHEQGSGSAAGSSTTSATSATTTSTAAATAPAGPGNPIPIPSTVTTSNPDGGGAYVRPADFDDIEREYMIVTGGFSDDDWDTFPVWALDLTREGEGEDDGEAHNDGADDNDGGEGSGENERGSSSSSSPAVGRNEARWYNLASSIKTTTTKEKKNGADFKTKEDGSDGGGDGDKEDDQDDDDDDDGNDNDKEKSDPASSSSSSASPSAPLLRPPGRVGHLSTVHDGVLHVFGGLLYRRNGFHLEDGVYVWRASIDGALPGGGAGSDGGGDGESGDDAPKNNGAGGATDEAGDGRVVNEDEDDEDGGGGGGGGLVWERLVPRIVDPDGDDGDGAVGIRPHGANPSGDDGFEPLPGAVAGAAADDDDVDAGGTVSGSDGEEEEEDDSGRGRHRRLSSAGAVPSGQEYHLPRGEVQGGHWRRSSSSRRRGSDDDDDDDERNDDDGEGEGEGDAFVLYGGLSVTHRPNPHRYASNPTVQIDEPLGDVWMYDYARNEFRRLAPYPPPSWQRDPLTGRYPVARTAHGATVVGDELVVYGGMNLNSEETAWDGTASWDALTDVWAFDLRERVWRERIVEPELARSYHSLVGWEDGSVAAFGGFRTAKTVAGDPIAFVFSDTIVSHPTTNTWLKAQWPQVYSARTVTNRLEHVAVVDKYGSMYVWGGRFKTVSQVYGVWRLDVFNRASSVTFAQAPPDGLDAYEAELEALHLLVAVMMFMSVMFTALYGSLRRQADDMANQNGHGGIISLAGRRRGLAPEVIDSLPVKTYGQTAAGDSAGEGDNFTIDSDDEDDTAGDTGDNVQPLEEEECCPICLVEYTVGESIRTLPCGHDFHRECVDPWLENNTSCPACRHALSNDVPEREGGSADDEAADRSSVGGDDDPSMHNPSWMTLQRSFWQVEHSMQPVTIVPSLSLSGLLARQRVLFGSHRPPEDVASSNASEAGVAAEATHDSVVDSVEDEFTNDENGETGQSMRPRGLRIGRPRGYGNIGPRPSRRRRVGGVTEMVELGGSRGDVEIV